MTQPSSENIDPEMEEAIRIERLLTMLKQARGKRRLSFETKPEMHVDLHPHKWKSS